MAFLIPSDYDAQIKNDLLQVIIKDSPRALPSAELAAQSELESYLRGRYDLPKIFIDVTPWAEARQYQAGAVVHHGTPAVLYVATRATKGDVPTELPADADDPEALPAAWKAEDPRHPLIITYLIDVALYLLHSRMNPRGIPDIRQDRYDHVIEWLNLCRQGKVSPGLPFLPDNKEDGSLNPDSIIRIRSGSHKKLRNTY